MVVGLAISGVEEKLTIRKKALTSCGGLGEEGEPSWRTGVLRGIRTSPTVTTFLREREHRDTSSSPRVSVISIPEFTSL